MVTLILKRYEYIPPDLLPPLQLKLLQVLVKRLRKFLGEGCVPPNDMQVHLDWCQNNHRPHNMILTVPFFYSFSHFSTRFLDGLTCNIVFQWNQPPFLRVTCYRFSYIYTFYEFCIVIIVIIVFVMVVNGSNYIVAYKKNALITIPGTTIADYPIRDYAMQLRFVRQFCICLAVETVF